MRVTLIGSLIVCCAITADELPALFHQIYPLGSFKSVVDTCMRSYSDMLILQDKVASRERVDDSVDLLVGRLMRLKSYIEQLLYQYKNEATVSYDELEYLMNMIEYLELTIAESSYNQVNQALNHITMQLKYHLKQSLGLVSFSIMPMLQPPYRFLPASLPLCQFV